MTEYPTRCPSPGETFEGRIVIASGWHRDDVIAVMSLNHEPPFYRISEIPLAPKDEKGNELYRFDDYFYNIVPAAREFSERFNLWHGDEA